MIKELQEDLELALFWRDTGNVRFLTAKIVGEDVARGRERVTIEEYINFLRSRVTQARRRQSRSNK